jgi:hypothetical protein
MPTFDDNVSALSLQTFVRHFQVQDFEEYR